MEEVGASTSELCSTTGAVWWAARAVVHCETVVTFIWKDFHGTEA